MKVEKLHELFLDCNGVSTDTRKLVPGSIFFALKGGNFNGNAFAEKAIEGGCCYAVIDEPEFASSDAFILVENVLEALQLLAGYHRAYLKIPVIAITGSNGKTTTKEILSRVLSTKYNTAVTKGNLNNHIGVPLTLLQMNNLHEIALIEMGDNHCGEVAFLCEIAKPSHGFITNIGKDHLEGFGSMESNFNAKKEIFDYLSVHRGIGFVNKRDADVVRAAVACKNIVYFGGEGLFSRINYLGSNPYVKYLDEENNEVQTALFGGYNFQNIELAYCIGKYFNIDAADINNAIKNFLPDNNRSQIKESGRNTLLLDAYNANPSSVELALNSLNEMDTSLNKLAILGDMFELGEFSAEEHQRMVDLVGEMPRVQAIFIGGNYANCLIHNEKNKCFSEKKRAEEYLKKNAPIGAVILLKGSRSMGLETLEPLL